MVFEINQDLNVEVEVRIKKVKTCTIRIHKAPPKIILTVNYRITDQEVFDILNKKIKFIRKAFLNSKIQNQLKENEYMLFGNIYQMNLNESTKNLKIEDNVIFAKSIFQIEQFAVSKLEERFHELELMHCFPKTSLYIHSMKSRWGVCYPNKHKIGLTKALIHVPFDCVDYVIYHEFCHYFEMNHSDKFHKRLQKYCPNEKEISKKLKIYSVYL